MLRFVLMVVSCANKGLGQPDVSLIKLCRSISPCQPCASQPAHSTHAFNEEERRSHLIFKFEFESSTFNVCKAVGTKKPRLCTGIDVDSLNGCKAEI
jgi:hypothetical protein